MTKKIVLFNGPPRSGKDTSAFIYSWVTDAHFEKFAMPLKRAFAAIMNTTVDAYGNVPYYEEHKSEVIALLGVSYRQFQIDLSEKFLKSYDREIFSKLLIDRIRGMEESLPVVVSDSGFEEEIRPLVSAFGEDELILIRLHRKGCDFSNDSRSYVSGVLPNEHDVDNNGSIEDLRQQLRSILQW